MKTANQTLEIIVEQGVEGLNRIEYFQELNNLQGPNPASLSKSGILQ
ncbi:hypothetical protein ACT7C1_15255 [Bacillus paranthracis]